ncbi:hypothetical protein D9619_007106 [Psilocybe cf. subviscida]|uniref:Uncharacterized protein n=1 Tax=Psilocybe cf. subviscida TaxID=2480587 RepID=A0A8H5B1U6_9AGAR|nr:hypothetical protein D9619_007106 [Psilocybe cf. subviscida]
MPAPLFFGVLDNKLAANHAQSLKEMSTKGGAWRRGPVSYDQYHPQAYFPSRSIRVVQQPALFHITLVAHSRLPSLCFPGTRFHSPPPDPVRLSQRWSRHHPVPLFEQCQLCS